ncbi:hypothetical protein [Sphingomonas turrisvirgatae]|uniref:Uncharacterized protein n=1 Tax=Sphingomonas turrisvirgatae TaxID=1888892 RepID=A0A1E3M059_9SPHN|nr:hypothetical protein [Sphingomonas turrisvirgatae]ODP39457.1 hypothetical protein BFL28_10315 [Sphingomonas turrisvirgatae]
MDLNQLLHRHQIALMCAQAAVCPEARYAHRGMATLYAERIDALRPHTDAPMQVAASAAALHDAG